MCTNTDRSVGKQSREVGDQTENRRVCYVRSIGGGHPCHHISDGGARHSGDTAKIINQFTLTRLVRAAGNMPKSTHRLIKLVRAKYEHCVFDS